MKATITLIALLWLGSVSFAQTSFWSFNWDVGFPTGETKDLVNKASFRGFSIDGRGFVNSNVTVGGKIAWQVFYESTNEPYKDQTTTVNAYQRRYVNAMPLMVTSHYNFETAGLVMPYAGLGVGTYYIESLYYFGSIGIQEKGWHFGFYPEVGLFVPFGEYSDWGLNLNFRYNYALKTADSRSHSWIGISLGFGYVL